MSGKKIQAAGNGSRYFARKWKWVLYLHFKEKEAGIPSSGNSSLGKKIQHEEQQRPGARKRLSADLENLTVCKQSCKSEAVIYYYSMYGHVAKLAEEIKKGAASVEGVEVRLWQVPETLSDEVLGKMGAPPKSDVPFLEPNELAEADGFIFGFPTRFGMMAAQFKAFLDATGGLWRTQQLAGKPAGIFFSTGSQGGGQETTALTAITQLVHHGMIFVPIGYTFGAGMFEMEKVKGGSPYGAGTYAGDGSRQPSELELEQAFHQGKYIAGIAKKLKEAA